MKTIQELNLGYSDAENYGKKSEKSFFNQVFFDDQDIDKLKHESTYFLIGEKGTGKTACAIYFKNQEFDNIKSTHNYVRETEYVKFIQMKQQKALVLSDYTSIWKVMIYLMISQQIYEDSKSWSTTYDKMKFKKLMETISNFYQNAFQPEFIHAIEFANAAETTAKLVMPIVPLEASISAQTHIHDTQTTFQTSLFAIEKAFKDAISSIKLSKHHYLFIDGIDFRPHHIPFENYLECVKGLANAVWSLNNDFFANIKDSNGRIKIVLLARPDIFNSFGLQNQNTKIKDNSVLLTWKTNYKNYKTSRLYKLVLKYLTYEQYSDNIWQHYFPFTISDFNSNEQNPFIRLLRLSLFRPRDILTMLKILQSLEITDNREALCFSKETFESSEFLKEYSNFMLGEIKDHMSFYYTVDEYELFIKFFLYLNGKSRFNYDDYCRTFQEFKDNNDITGCPLLPKDNDTFLQLLYDLDIICVISTTEQGEPFFSWCHRDRTPMNLSPKVKTGYEYEVHYSLRKALSLGAGFKRK